MRDTPRHIYDLQLKSWLAKSPAERLRQLMIDNDALFKFWREARPVKNTVQKFIITKSLLEFNKKK